MREFKKLDFAASNGATAQAPFPARSRLRNRPKFKLSFSFSGKKLLPLLAVIVVLGVFSFFTILLPAQRTYSAAMKTAQQGRLALNAAKQQNIQVANAELKKTKEELIKTQKELHSFTFAKYIPLVNIYYNDADHMLSAGFHGIDAALILIESVEPYADVLGLKGQGSFVMGSAENRIQTAILTMGKVTPRIDEIAEKLKLAQKEVDEVNPSHYPSFLVGSKIHGQIESMRTITDQGVVFVDEARPLIKVLPVLLGESKEKKYLILFQNDKELRPTGGFITAYAVFAVDRGVIRVDKSDDIYNLDNSLRVKTKPPTPITKYLPKVTTFNIRDTNLSPDFVESMTTFNSLYKDARDKVEVDGIIALDTHVLASVIKILDGQVTAGGITFKSDIDKRCNCPHVVYELEQITDKPQSLDLRITSLASVQAHRKDIIGTLLYAIMQKALKSSPKLYWGPLVQEMIKETSEKHVLFYLYEKDAQSGVEALNAGGRIKDFEGDYLHINDSNMGGAKSNMFVKQSVNEEYQVAGDGTITKTVTISYKNPFAPSNCNLEAGLVCLNAVLRDWVRVYVPKGSQLIESKGSEVKLSTYEELDKTVFDGFLTVKPLGSSTYTLKYKLPFKVAKGSPLPTLRQKQPGTDDNEYTVKLNGKTIKTFKLLSDTEVELKP